MNGKDLHQQYKNVRVLCHKFPGISQTWKCSCWAACLEWWLKTKGKRGITQASLVTTWADPVNDYGLKPEELLRVWSVQSPVPKLAAVCGKNVAPRGVQRLGGIGQVSLLAMLKKGAGNDWVFRSNDGLRPRQCCCGISAIGASSSTDWSKVPESGLQAGSSNPRPE